MGMFPFKKKTKSTSTPQPATLNVGTTPTTEISRQPSTLNTTGRRTGNNNRTNVVTPATDGSSAVPKWSPIRKILSSAKSPSRNDSNVKPTSGSTPFSTVNVAGKDSIEVMTLESQQKLIDQREAIRKKLFETGNTDNNNASDDDEENDVDQFSVYGSSLHTPPRHSRQAALLKRSATDTSLEVLPSGRIQDTIIEKYNFSKSSDRFSLPIQQVSRSWDNGSLLQIAEEPVEYGAGTKFRSTGPISVDLSYTDSELASVRTKRYESESEVLINNQTQSVYESPIVTSLIPNSPDSTTVVLNSPDSTTAEASTGSVAATASTGLVGSPANTSRSSTIPMDEKLDELEYQRRLNSGKSPLRGMPDDEQYEYQKDEMESLPISPLRNLGLGLTNLPSFRLLQKNDSKSASTTVAPSAVSPDRAENDEDQPIDVEMKGLAQQHLPSTDSIDILQSKSVDNIPPSSPSLSRVSDVPAVGLSILQKVSEWGSGALNNTTLSTANESKICANPVEIALSRGKVSVDETASLTTNNSIRQRPVYLEEASALRFLRRITNNGFVLLYLQPPEEDSNDDDIDDWKGRTVTIMVQKGQLSSNHTRGYIDQQSSENLNRGPKLEWTTVTGGYTMEAKTTSIDLLNIQSISTNDEVDVDDDDDLCFFTITSGDGDIHVFETATVEERDRIVNGLKTLIARWSFHVIAGEVTATSELFDTCNSSMERNLNESDDELPSLPNPHLTMNCVAHMLLDAEI